MFDKRLQEDRSVTYNWYDSITSKPFMNIVNVNRQDETRFMSLRLGYKFAEHYSPCIHCEEPVSPIHIITMCHFMSDHIKVLIIDLQIDNGTLNIQPDALTAQILLASEDDGFSHLLKYLHEYYKQ